MNTAELLKWLKFVKLLQVKDVRLVSTYYQQLFLKQLPKSLILNYIICTVLH